MALENKTCLHFILMKIQWMNPYHSDHWDSCSLENSDLEDMNHLYSILQFRSLCLSHAATAVQI